jgi:hypothetical protein
MRKLIAFCMFLLMCCAQTLPAAEPAPRLVVLISIDQFPYYYIPRFQPYFTEGGFNRFLQHGATFSEARYTYSGTYTAPGHAALGSGNPSSINGIVQNHWWDRFALTSVYCTDDARASSIIPGEGFESLSMSPVNLTSDSLGDRLQEHYPASRVFGVALKDRAAILMAGRKATAAYWFDSGIGGFLTTTYYRGADKALLESFNRGLPEFFHQHLEWTQSSSIPDADLARITHDPEKLRKYKKNEFELGRSFPHPIHSTEALIYTPYGNQITLQFAERLIETETLGANPAVPDLLFVSLSSPDFIGHSFGPDSLEAADSVMRTDRDIAGFLDWLEQRFGDGVTVALSSDHGVQSIPEVARDLGRDAGRVEIRNPKNSAETFAQLSPGRRLVEEKIARRLGIRVSDTTSIAQAFIVRLEEPSLYLNWPRINAAHLDADRVLRAARDAVREVKGVATSFTSSELLATTVDSPAVQKMVRRSFRPDRSGDVIVILKPGYIWDYGLNAGTTHGQPIEADQHVPIMMWGHGVKPGKYTDSVAPTDLARTLGALVGVDAGGVESHVLPCVVVQ